MNKDEIANYKLQIWRELMNHGDHATDPTGTAARADEIYEQFYLGKKPAAAAKCKGVKATLTA